MAQDIYPAAANLIAARIDNFQFYPANYLSGRRYER